MNDLYKTIKSASQGFFKDRLSKFYAFAFPVASEEEVEKYRKELRKKYHDARHHVYAFVLGADKSIYRYSDDGEPANSSGPPVLNAIKSFDLTNVLVVVVRYFGGKKLGVPGLINAYRSAAEDALQNAEIIEKTDDVLLRLAFDYNQMNTVMSFLKKNAFKILQQDFVDNKNIVDVAVRKSKVEFLKDKLLPAGIEINFVQ